ncbi:hypothetical protein V8F33_004494 [Rhypophila sp. PSN 637]
MPPFGAPIELVEESSFSFKAGHDISASKPGCGRSDPFLLAVPRDPTERTTANAPEFTAASANNGSGVALKWLATRWKCKEEKSQQVIEVARIWYARTAQYETSPSHEDDALVMSSTMVTADLRLRIGYRANKRRRLAGRYNDQSTLFYLRRRSHRPELKDKMTQKKPQDLFFSVRKSWSTVTSKFVNRLKQGHPTGRAECFDECMPSTRLEHGLIAAGIEAQPGDTQDLITI